MRSANLLRPALAVGLLAMTSCATSSLTYVEETRGFAVTRGEMVRVENLNSPGKEQLSDGVALEIDEPGCRVTLRIEEVERIVEIGPGGQLVLGGGVDAVLQPLSASRGSRAMPEEQGPAPATPFPSAATERSSPRPPPSPR